MSEVRITAEPRTEFGKGYARRTRMAGKVPAVLYGHGTETRHVSLPARELGFALRGGANVLLRLDLGGSTELALPRAIVRHPLRGEYTHLDLLLVRQGEMVTVDVPVHVTGTPADKEGIVDQPLASLSVSAEATHIPTGVEVSVDGLTIGGSVHAGDVTLPTGVTLLTDPEAIVVHVVGHQAEPTEEGAEGAEAPAEGGAEAAPAAEAAAEPTEA